jgi:hypothetical protein
VIREAATVPEHFPLLRPASRSFELWAAARPDVEDRECVQLGIEAMGWRERRRIVLGARRLGDGWRNVTAGFGDERVAERALLAGAVVSGLREREPPDELALELLEERDDLREDPAEALSLVLEACDLWSIVEAEQLDLALAELPGELDDYEYETLWHRTIGSEARRLAGAHHRRRLELLVRRLRQQLPFDRYPLASAALTRACDAFERVPGIRERLLALLLADTLGPLRDIQLGRAA